jgi:serine/threonine-protein kinase
MAFPKTRRVRVSSAFRPLILSVGLAVPPPSTTLVSPEGNLRTGQPTFVWNAVSAATEYHLWVSGPSRSVFQRSYSAAAVCGAICSVTPSPGLGTGTHTWKVQTRNSAGPGPWSASKSFYIAPQLSRGRPVAPTVESPTGTIAETEPTYRFRASTAATDYYLGVNGASGPVVREWFSAGSICSGASCAATPSTTLSPGEHTWWVQARNGAGNSRRSGSLRFTVEEPRGDRDYFPRGAIWYQDVSAAALDPQSAQVIAWLQSAGGWGLGRMQIDFSIEVLEADDSTPIRSFIPTSDHYTPDCDFGAVPVPPGGALEGESGYECESDGDCHLIVALRSRNRLYEMWRANVVGGTFFGGCLAVWDMSKVYGPSGRGENCTSADAAGYPIAPLLFTADEVEGGEIAHAIRFILPNSRIRNGVYVHPATHSTGAASAPSPAPPYGTRLRLRADFPLDTLPNDAARVVARALQKYGMFLADGGSVALTAQSDRFTTAKWSGLLGPRDLQAIQVTDFEMLDGGPRIAYTGDCVRTPD